MGSPDDFTSHFDEMFTVAYRAAFAVLGDRGDAEDCAQETLAKALVRWRRIGGRATPWVARVATNGAIDRWRLRQRSTTRSPDDASMRDDATDVDTPNPGLAAQRDALVRALRALPRRQREAVVLRHLLDLSENDTAAALTCSTGTVKSATSRGLARLRVLLDDPTIAPDPARK